jgi:hypothetical protein
MQTSDDSARQHSVLGRSAVSVRIVVALTASRARRLSGPARRERAQEKAGPLRVTKVATLYLQRRETWPPSPGKTGFAVTLDGFVAVPVVRSCQPLPNTRTAKNGFATVRS